MFCFIKSIIIRSPHTIFNSSSDELRADLKKYFTTKKKTNPEYSCQGFSLE